MQANRKLGQAHYVKMPSMYSWLIWLWMALSSVVLIEPAPYDLIFILCFITALVFSYVSFSSHLWPAILLVYLFVFSNLISMYKAPYPEEAAFFCSITVYLCFTWFFVVGLLDRDKDLVLKKIFSGYTAAAILAAVLGILAYFRLIPNAENLLEWGRVSSVFKDPNVFGPFLVPVTLYTLYCFEISRKLSIRILWLLLFIIFIVAVLLSYSRASWANCALAVFIFLILPPEVSLRKRLLTIAALAFLVTPAFLMLVSHPDVSWLLKLRLDFQNYDYYRFATHIEALQSFLNHPLGIGPGQAGLLLSYDTHNLYLRIASENGVLGTLFFLWFLLVTVVRSFRQSFSKTNNFRPYSVIVTASLVGLLFNSYFIDSLHWRHLWILLAIPWMPGEGRIVRNESSANNYPVR